MIMEDMMDYIFTAFFIAMLVVLIAGQTNPVSSHYRTDQLLSSHYRTDQLLRNDTTCDMHDIGKSQ